ncbi:MAG: Dipeptidyl aminopeptidase BIII [Chlamydiia bacterium]|nr:Dipeptidyl aminopeptidase BIII [Chlamydiia bacterium]
MAVDMKLDVCRLPELISARISPDGKYVAKVGADDGGIANVSVGLSDDLDFHQVSFFKTPQIIQFYWASDSRSVLVIKDHEGKGCYSLLGVDIASGEVRQYVDGKVGDCAKVYHVSQTGNGAVIGVRKAGRHFFDLYRLDFATGEMELMEENGEFVKFLIRDDLSVGLRMRINSDGSWTLLTGEHEVWMELSVVDAIHMEFLRVVDDAVYFLDSRTSDYQVLTKRSLHAPYSEEVLLASERGDFDEWVFVDGRPVACATNFTQLEWQAVGGGEYGVDIGFLKGELGRNFRVLSQSRDQKIWVVSISIPTEGEQFWVYHRSGERRLVRLGQPREDCFAQMYDFVAPTRDGWEVACYYTLPVEKDLGGRVAEPLPMVVFIHGGPHKGRDRYGYSRDHQWLASLGYGVLSVNYRLSAGYGRKSLEMGFGQWGKIAHEDVIDAAEEAIRMGLTERGKLAIMGGSYGGYEALASLTFSPGYFTCHVAERGPSNLKSVLKCVPLFWEFTPYPLADQQCFFTKSDFITCMGGDPDTDEGAAYLESCSPLNYIDAIQGPLLLTHGRNDHVVVESESDQIYHKMEERGLDVRYLVFYNEGHRFATQANILYYLNAAEMFLSEHLGGRHIPVDPEAVVEAEVYESATR